MSDRRLRAPQTHGAVLAVPPLDQVPSLLADNRRRCAGSLSILGASLRDLWSRTRRQVLACAAAYLRQSGEPVPEHHSQALFVAGHQPELFHPGVWVKNFALCGLARKHHGASLNLVVDNDTAKSTMLRLPQGSHLLHVPFDHWQGEVPYEERPVLDEELFAGLPERIAGHAREWNFTPMLEDFWREARRQAERTSFLGERLAAARRLFERRWGCHNLEVPLSMVCDTESFAYFACHLLSELPRFQAIYNSTVRAYRADHAIRSRNHPVPDLETVDGDWLEAPFWAWQRGQPRRRRLYARQSGQSIDLRMGLQELPALPMGDPRRLVAAWQELGRQGFKIRSRALTTTLFARVFLADLFVHGIGGGKYDELTDEIVRRFYDLEPPHFTILSATLLLPFPRPPVHADVCRKLGQRFRDVHYNPQRHLQEAIRMDPQAQELAREKQAWIGKTGGNREERVERFHRLREITEKLRAYLNERERETLEAWRQCREQLAFSEVRSRRDYAFCLYPEEELRPFLQSFL